jgi:hypothetical protein
MFVAYDRVLLYGKGGGAWVGNNSFTVTNVTTGASITGSNSRESGSGPKRRFTAAQQDVYNAG